MTDAPFTETLRSFSKLCGGGNEDVAAAIDAALAEIDRLRKQLDWACAIAEPPPYVPSRCIMCGGAFDFDKMGVLLKRGGHVHYPLCLQKWEALAAAAEAGE
jgi:hypothetical protein